MNIQKYLKKNIRGFHLKGKSIQWDVINYRFASNLLYEIKTRSKSRFTVTDLNQLIRAQKNFEYFYIRSTLKCERLLSCRSYKMQFFFTFKPRFSQLAGSSVWKPVLSIRFMNFEQTKMRWADKNSRGSQIEPFLEDSHNTNDISRIFNQPFSEQLYIF